MCTVKVKWFAQTMALAWLGFAQITYADEALTARNKALVRDFYTTVLIGRQVDAAAAISQHRLHSAQPERADWIEGLYGYISQAI